MTSRRVEQRRRKDGSVFWTRADGRAVDPQDPLKGSVWTVEDVTEQRRAEDELQRVLAEQQALLDNVVVGIAISRERKVVRCNRRFEEMFGFGAGEANGVSWRQMYFTEEEFELRGQVYADLDQGRTHGREQWLRRQDGSGFWCKVSGRAVAAGRPGARLRLAHRGHQRAPARRRGARAPGARAGRGAAERGDRHHLRQGPAHRALQPALRGHLRLRPGRAAQPLDALHVRERRRLRGRRRGAVRAGVARRDGLRRAAPRAQGRHAHLVLALRARGAARRPGAGLGLAVRRHHAGARVRGTRAARAGRAGADPRQRLGRHRLRAQPRDPALQPLPRGHGRRRPGRADRPEHREHLRLAHRLGGGRAARLCHHAAGRHLRRRGALSPPRRHHLHLPRARPAHRYRRGGPGVDLELRGRHRRARGGNARAAGARRAGPDPRQRHRRHRLRAQPRDPALQPLPRGDVRRAARRAGRPALGDPVRERGGLEGGRAPRVRGHPAGRHPRRRRAPEARRRLDLPLLDARPAHRRRRQRAGMDLELRGRHRRARGRPARAAGPRRARARGGRAHRRARGGEGPRPASRRPRRAHRAAQPPPAGGPPDAGARAQLPQPARTPR